MHRFRSWVVLLVVTAVSLLAVAPAIAQEATPGVAVDGVTVLEPDETYAGVSRGEWNARWIQWILSFPADTGPGVDPTGERCGYGQSGPVFFLPTNLTGEPSATTCVVPEGMAIFVPISGAVCSTVHPPPFFGRTEAELQTCATTAMEGTRVEASVNGQEVPGLERYRAGSPLFTMTFPEDNFYGVPAAVALTVVEGYAFIIAPPSPGEYEITKLTIFSNPTEAGGTTYRVIVEAPQVIEPEATPAAGTPVATPAT